MRHAKEGRFIPIFFEVLSCIQTYVVVTWNPENNSFYDYFLLNPFHCNHKKLILFQVTTFISGEMDKLDHLTNVIGILVFLFRWFPLRSHRRVFC